MTAIKWKKLISLLLALMALSGSALAEDLQITLDGEAVDSLTLNVGDTVPLRFATPHTHHYSAATCMMPATCECGDTMGDADKSSHAGGTEIRNAKEASLTEKGYTGDIYCLGCSSMIAQGEEIPAKGGVIVKNDDDAVAEDMTYTPGETPVEGLESGKTCNVPVIGSNDIHVEGAENVSGIITQTFDIPNDLVGRTDVVFAFVHNIDPYDGAPTKRSDASESSLSEDQADDGVMQSEWQFKWEIGGWLMDEDGGMQSGWQFIRGNWFYFDTVTGMMLKNTTTPDGYTVDANGVWVQ